MEPPFGDTGGIASPNPGGLKARGQLRIFLGAAPGSGKTFAMLNEARQRREQGEEVVVGYVETHGRKLTEQAIGDLEVIPRATVIYREKSMEEMDLAAVLARGCKTVLVDELAHSNVPGAANSKRYQDVLALLDAGIDVITTVNVQHLESVKDLVEAITGITVRETLPDRVLDEATEIQYIDISPEALRKRLQHGNVYHAAKIEDALHNFFRPGNLAALREIALRLMAQNTGSSSRVVRPAGQNVLVAVHGGSQSGNLIRRAARIARRLNGFCTVLTVITREVEAEPAKSERAKAEEMARLLGCGYLEKSGKPNEVVAGTALELGVEHVVIGELDRQDKQKKWGKPLIEALLAKLEKVDIHVIAWYLKNKPGHKLEYHRPDSDTLMRALQAGQIRAGLRVYLGYADGCGTTYAMLEEAKRRSSRGTEVVVAALNTRGSAKKAALIADLEVLGGPSSPAWRGQVDVEALLKRNPEVACLDDLAGADSLGRPLVEAVPKLLEAGMVLLATLHLTDLASIRAGLGAGVELEKTAVPDSILPQITELEIVDVTPERLFERLRKSQRPALTEELERRSGARISTEVLKHLRELGFRMIAEHTERRLVTYMRERGIDKPWEAQARIMLCLPPWPGMEPVIERVALMAERQGGHLVAVTVKDKDRGEAEKLLLGSYAALVHISGGEYVTLAGNNTMGALADYARHMLATEVVITRGRGRRGRLQDLIGRLSEVDVHILQNPGK